MISFFALTVVFDLIDTLIKGSARYAKFSAEYWFRVPLYLVLCGVAIISASCRFHIGFVSLPALRGLVDHLIFRNIIVSRNRYLNSSISDEVTRFPDKWQLSAMLVGKLTFCSPHLGH